MSDASAPPALDRDHFDAALFDLDGVLADTVRAHATCWKRTFDAFLEARAAAHGEPFAPFTDDDYARWVDGKPRFEGVRDFLATRSIELPPGSPDDPPERDTVAGLANRKNELVERLLEEEGVEAIPGSVALVRRLRQRGLRTGVVSSSANCAAVLKAARIADLFETRVDGRTLDERGLAGKPAPDPFLEAARELGVEPKRSVVIEDAISGILAGRAGGFGLVIGLARKGDAEALAAHGADVVVEDLAELIR